MNYLMDLLAALPLGYTVGRDWHPERFWVTRHSDPMVTIWVSSVGRTPEELARFVVEKMAAKAAEG
jgi:hypothetical protein